MNLLYEECLKLIEKGHFERARERLLEMRLVLDESSDNELGLIQKILNARIHLKAESLDEMDPLPDPRQFPELSDWIAAELAFVRGLAAFHLGDFESGITEFSFSKEKYARAQQKSRALLAAYQIEIGQLRMEKKR